MVGFILTNLLKYTCIVMYTRVLYSERVTIHMNRIQLVGKLGGGVIGRFHYCRINKLSSVYNNHRFYSGLQGYPQRMRLYGRLYGISQTYFLKLMIPAALNCLLNLSNH